MYFRFTLLCLLVCCNSYAQQLKLTIRQTLQNTQYEFLGKADFNINGTKVSGQILWSIKKADPKDRVLRSKMNATGIEFVSGSYDAESHKMYFNGISKNDPSNILALDVYQLVLAENGNVSGTTRGSGKWDGIIDGQFTIDNKAINNTYADNKAISNKTADNKTIVAEAPQSPLSADDQECIAFIQHRAENFSPYVKIEGSVATFKTSNHYRVIERYADNTPKVIRFNMIYGYYSPSAPPEIRSVDALLKNKLPYILYPTGQGNSAFASTFPTDYLNLDYPYPKMDQAMINTIKRLSAAYMKEALVKEVNNPSYQKVLSIQNSYPANYNVRNCLQLVYYMENDGHYEMTKTPGAGVVQTHEFVLDGESEHAAYQNMTRHPVVIKGISFDKSKPDNQYKDESVVLKPGQIIELSEMEHYKPQLNLNELYQYRKPQYYGDLGIVKKTRLVVDRFSGEVLGKIKN